MNRTLPISALAFAIAAFPMAAQTTPPATAPAHRVQATAAHTASAAHACAKVPQLSPKIPALPASLPCAKPLYTITNVPSVKLDYVSPLEGTGLRESLGIESSSFSLSYIDTKVGTGELAAPHKWYTIKYTGYLVNGTKFDSSADHPEQEGFTFQYGEHQVVAGWDTGFAGMRVGGKRRLFIPYQLAYGPAGHGAIPPQSELIFDVELMSQSDGKPAPRTPPTPPPPATPAPSATPAPAAAPATSAPPATPPPPAAAASAAPETPPAPTPATPVSPPKPQ